MNAVLQKMQIMEDQKWLNVIACLPKKYRTVLRMKYTQDLTLAEMALITGQSKNAIAVQVHRAREKIKSMYSLT